MIVVDPKQQVMNANRFVVRLLPVLMVCLSFGCSQSVETSSVDEPFESAVESALQDATTAPVPAATEDKVSEALPAAPAGEPAVEPKSEPATIPATEIVVADPTASPAVAEVKAKRAPIYDTETPGEELIAAALKRGNF